MKNTALINSSPKTSPRHRKIRVTRRQRTPENGAISTKSLGTKPMNVAQNSHWWPRSKTRSETLIQNLILKIMVKDRSSTQTPLLLSHPQQFNQKNQQILKRRSAFFIQRCGWRGPCYSKICLTRWNFLRRHFPFPYADLKSLFVVPIVKNCIFPHIHTQTSIKHAYT